MHSSDAKLCRACPKNDLHNKRRHFECFMMFVKHNTNQSTPSRVQVAPDEKMVTKLVNSVLDEDITISRIKASYDHSPGGEDKATLGLAYQMANNKEQMANFREQKKQAKAGQTIIGFLKKKINEIGKSDQQ